MEILSKKEEVAGMISVVIPVYNVEKYLAECLDSVLSQTFKNYEVLLVDDGSPDSSGQICDNYASKDARIRVFHKENGGVSSARKLGVENARGEWIVFVDSDDKLFPNSLEDLFRFSENFPQADLIEGGVVREDCYEEITGEPVLVSAEKYLAEVAKETGFFYPGPWKKMFRKNILIETRAMSFPKWIYYGEDELMCYRFATKACCFLKIPKIVYFWRRNLGGVTHAKRPSASYNLDWIKEAEKELSGFPRGIFVASAKKRISDTYLNCKDWQKLIGNSYFQMLVAELWPHRERFSKMTKVMLLAIRIPFPWLRSFVRTVLLMLVWGKSLPLRVAKFLGKQSRGNKFEG